MRTNKRTISNGQLIWHDSFGSVSEFAEWVNTTPYNNFFKKRSEIFICNRERTDASWCGTATWAEAQELLIKGYPDGLKKMLECNDAIKFTQEHKGCPQPAMVGYAPHIANAIMGLPKTMIRRPNVERNVKTVSLYYDTTIHKDISQRTLLRGGANLMALLKYLDSKHYRVNLNIMCGASAKVNGNFQHQIVSIKVKDSRQALNPLLLSYPITHSSFFRRHIITYLECAEGTDKREFKGGGCPMKDLHYSVGDMQTYLRTNGIITNNDYYLDCQKVADAKSIDEILEQINFN